MAARDETSSLADDSGDLLPAPPRERDEAPPVRAGENLGRYTIRARIGGGGMGEVFSAHDPELDRSVAIKVIRSGVAGESPEARARFQREAQAMARLNHPNVVSIYDVGTLGERVFVAMELVGGPTVAEWLAERPRGWREVVEVFLPAGRGLAAAHAAGIVHRDFKPANVIVGDRVRVADFGLARAVYEAELPSGPSDAPIDTTVTRTGRALGTPAYMAPEQRAGSPASPQSDQYSFAVALHEALFGVRPGLPAPPRAVPGALRGVVERALRPRPEERYPSMVQLLADLGRDPVRARRRLLAAAAAVLVVGAVAAGGRALEAPPCGGEEALIAPLWDDAARAEVAAAFRATGRSSADDAFARADAGLRGRQVAWGRAHRDACEATHVRREQSEALLDLRMRCLARARAEMTDLVALLRRADARTVDHAAEATRQVGELESCADPAALAATAPPPRDPAAVAAVEGDLARLVALRSLGHWKEALELGRPLVERARQAGYPRALARVLQFEGVLEVDADGDSDRAVAQLFEAARAGTIAGDDAIVARALTDTVYVLGRLKHRYDAADAVYQLAGAAVARVGNPPPILADLLANRAAVLVEQGDLLGALPLRFTTLGIRERTAGPGSLAVASALDRVGQLLVMLGRTREALPFTDRAVVTADRAVGPRNPSLATLLVTAGNAHQRLGDLDGAASALERGLALNEEAFGPDAPRTAMALFSLSRLRRDQRRLPEARALVERAIRIRTASLGPSHAQVARGAYLLAGIARLEGDAGEAHRLYQTAIAAQRNALGAGHPELADSYRDDAQALLDLGRAGEARTAVEQALSIDVKTLGEQHPDTAESRRALADVMCAEDRCAEAAPLYQRAVAAAEHEAGGDSPMLVEPLSGLCAALLAAGDAAGARRAGERAIAVAAVSGVEARARACLARASPR